VCINNSALIKWRIGPKNSAPLFEVFGAHGGVTHSVVSQADCEGLFAGGDASITFSREMFHLRVYITLGNITRRAECV